MQLGRGKSAIFRRNERKVKKANHFKKDGYYKRAHKEIEYNFDKPSDYKLEKIIAKIKRKGRTKRWVEVFVFTILFVIILYYVIRAVYF
ncbi:MAG: hypothetical protein V3U92_19005 [Cellulophaga sp.]